MMRQNNSSNRVVTECIKLFVRLLSGVDKIDLIRCQALVTAPVSGAENSLGITPN
ncbi:hypothetical protein [Desmospora activa]|uniref:Uncharacterized protein n=1 Tax=Desmospora activa DSM 45169 TaxID=1121389 RepID=A0A2T4ZAH7_9BACL|nr:hypothetical protein [Desmospora activa]PTM58876.1 hypothetical protein C8J48_1475 [Desmospora activa DSM 45169]